MMSRALRRGIGIALLLSLCISGCSLTNSLSLAVATETVTVKPTVPATETPGPTDTITPTQPTPSFTPTPTLIYLFSPQAPIATTTPAMAQSLTPTVPSTPTATISTLFSDVAVSITQIFWGACTPSSTLIKVHVDASTGVQNVLLAIRLQNPKTADTTPWGGYPLMKRLGQGDFSYELYAKSFSGYHNYSNAWGQFQFIGINRNGDIIARSEPFLKSIVVAPCP